MYKRQFIGSRWRQQLLRDHLRSNKVNTVESERRWAVQRKISMASSGTYNSTESLSADSVLSPWYRSRSIVTCVSIIRKSTNRSAAALQGREGHWKQWHTAEKTSITRKRVKSRSMDWNYSRTDYSVWDNEMASRVDTSVERRSGYRSTVGWNAAG